MNRTPCCIFAGHPLRAALATALLALTVGAAFAVPASDDPVALPVFEQDFPASEPASTSVGETSITEYSDNQMSEALFAEPEVVMLLMALAGFDPLQTP